MPVTFYPFAGMLNDRNRNNIFSAFSKKNSGSGTQKIVVGTKWGNYFFTNFTQ